MKPEGPSGSRASWVSLLAGRTLQRWCQGAQHVCTHTGCALRPICRCAQEEMVRAAKVENRFWVVLLCICAAAITLWLTAWRVPWWHSA